jgi:hypothetical protein
MDGGQIPARRKTLAGLRDQKRLQPANRHIWEITPVRDLIVFVVALLLLWFV